jgi:hypothetical protein
MPKPPKKGNDPSKDEGEEKQPRREPPTLGNPDADPVKIHRDYVNRRLAGPGPATPEAYERALDQWRQLPGAVTTSPIEINPKPEKPPDREQRSDAPSDTRRSDDERKP